MAEVLPRVYLSTSVSSRNGRPSCVRSATKSYAQTWSRYSGRNRMHDPSFNHNLPRFGCLLGTFNPSDLQIRSTRLWFTHQPSSSSVPVIRGVPYRPYTEANSMIRCVSGSSCHPAPWEDNAEWLVTDTTPDTPASRRHPDNPPPVGPPAVSVAGSEVWGGGLP